MEKGKVETEESAWGKRGSSNNDIQDKMSEEQLRIELKNARNEISDLDNQLNSALKSIDLLIKRIAQLESSNLHRFRKYLSLYFRRLSANFRTGDKNKNFFSILVHYAYKRGMRVLRIMTAKILEHIYLLVEPKRVLIIRDFSGVIATPSEYSQYFIRKEITNRKKNAMLNAAGHFRHKPLLSIIMPVYNPPIEFFKEALDSIINQIYTNWEICLADDCSTDPEVKKTIDDYCSRYANIKVIYRTVNGHISKASNSALEIATGEFSVLMDHDDLLRENALFEIVKSINKNPDVDLIYTDEDKIDEYGVHSKPHFKPDWAPDSLLSRNYLGHVCVFKTSQLRAIGGWRVGFEGSQDYDLVLRYTENYNKIYHIPEVLYHWRNHAESAASGETAKPYAYRAAQRALTEAMTRRGWQGKIDFLSGFRGYQVRLAIKDGSQLVSIIIPSKNKQDYLKTCVNSIIKKSTYRNFEIVLVDNNSDETDFFKLVDEWKNQTQFTFKYVRDEKPFNFSRLINAGRSHASGKYLILLNNDTEIITTDWIECFIEHVQRPEIGVAGCKLLYEDDTIQHAGVVVGLGEVAAHVFVAEDKEGPGYFNYVNLLNNFSAVTAACFMVRADVFDQVKGFNEEFAIEYNDIDFCLKVAEAGYRNIYIPHIELYHYESISRGSPHSNVDALRKHVREMNKFKRKWGKYISHDPSYNPNLTLSREDYSIKVDVY